MRHPGRSNSRVWPNRQSWIVGSKDGPPTNVNPRTLAKSARMRHPEIQNPTDSRPIQDCATRQLSKLARRPRSTLHDVAGLAALFHIAAHEPAKDEDPGEEEDPSGDCPIRRNISLSKFESPVQEEANPHGHQPECGGCCWSLYTRWRHWSRRRFKNPRAKYHRECDGGEHVASPGDWNPRRDAFRRILHAGKKRQH